MKCCGGIFHVVNESLKISDTTMIIRAAVLCCSPCLYCTYVRL